MLDVTPKLLAAAEAALAAAGAPLSAAELVAAYIEFYKFSKPNHCSLRLAYEHMPLF